MKIKVRTIALGIALAVLAVFVVSAMETSYAATWESKAAAQYNSRIEETAEEL